MTFFWDTAPCSLALVVEAVSTSYYSLPREPKIPLSRHLNHMKARFQNDQCLICIPANIFEKQKFISKPSKWTLVAHKKSTASESWGRFSWVTCYGTKQLNPFTSVRQVTERHKSEFMILSEYIISRLFSVVVAVADNELPCQLPTGLYYRKAFCLYFRNETGESVEIFTLSDAVNERPLWWLSEFCFMRFRLPISPSWRAICRGERSKSVTVKI
jgi:hypothetical protein